MLKRLVEVKANEKRPLLWAFAYFFCLLCSYYILRPVRDEMGIQGGVRNLQWVFTGTFIAMLAAVPFFGAVASRFPRRTLLPIIYYFFIANLLGFYALFATGVGTAQVARVFFIWVSVFNLFVVSVFWSFMADLFTNEQARRLFGFIAAGGSVGAIVGPGLTAALVRPLGPIQLLLISALLLLAAVGCIHRLLACGAELKESGKPARERNEISTLREEAPLGGGILSGVKSVSRSPYLLGICLYIWLYTTLSTFLYFEQAHIVAVSFADSAQRTTVFATMDLAVNALTVFGQIFLTWRIIDRLGLALTLALVPLIMGLGFAALGMFPVPSALIVFQVLRRAGNYAIARPAREILFTVVGREEKYKAKNFMDTVIYRGGDAVSGWIFAGLTSMGLGLSGIAFVAVPVAAVWAATGIGWSGSSSRLNMGQNHTEATLKSLHGDAL